MAINGLGSSMGYYSYQSSINNFRLAQALSKNPRFTQAVSPVSKVTSNAYKNTELSSSMDFIKDYSSSMSDLMKSASALKSTSRNGVMNDLVVSSSNESVAKATEKLTVRNAQQIEVDVQQLAAAQVNVSEGVKASDKASSDMDFTVGNAAGSVNVKVSSANSDGSAKTNAQMIKEAADQINAGSSNVTASVVEKDGAVSLQLTGKSTGAANGFEVSGNLGAAAGADAVKTAAANAKYSITTGGKTTQKESYSNDVSADSYKIGIELKGVGKTTIKADVDSEKIASAISDLVGSYNSSLKLLNDNYDRGTGVDKQLRNLVAGLGSEKSLKQLGITVNKDATLSFDKATYAKNMKDNPSLTRSLISGAGGVADRAFSKASSGMTARSSSLIDGDLANAQSSSFTNPMLAFGSYSRSGAYAMNNYAAVGTMLNYLI